jgi:phytanoyl-CoA hydroxylase
MGAEAKADTLVVSTSEDAMTMTLATSETSLVSQYARQGYVAARCVIDQELVAEGRRHVEWLMARHPQVRPEHLGHTLVAQDPFWVRLVSDSRLLDLAEQFIGPDIALFASHYIAKPPRDGQQVLWHQDGSYWPLDPMQVVTIWLALDDSTPENGCLRVIPGSHLGQLQEMKPRTDVVSVLGSGIDGEHVDESLAADVILQAGDVSIHHPGIIHGSNANHSALWRRGLTIRYIPTSTRITNSPWECAFLLRGRPCPGINDYLQRPRYRAGEHLPFRGCEAWS